MKGMQPLYIASAIFGIVQTVLVILLFKKRIGALTNLNILALILIILMFIPTDTILNSPIVLVSNLAYIISIIVPSGWVLYLAKETELPDDDDDGITYYPVPRLPNPQVSYGYTNRRNYQDDGLYN
jgi:hypothetical protein